MMSVLCVTIFWVVNASSGEKSFLQFSIPTCSGLGGGGEVIHIDLSEISEGQTLCLSIQMISMSLISMSMISMTGSISCDCL